MKLLQINTSVNSGSTGRMAEDVGKIFISKGHESYIAYGRRNQPSQSRVIKIGNRWDVLNHGLKTAVCDRHGFGSVIATKALIKEIDEIKPDVTGLHNLHGYYLNIEVLFDYLQKLNIPVVWTLFDCWAFTGHCSYFDDINCTKWITGCFSCPKTKQYPSSYILDNSRRNFLDKKSLFTRVKKLHIIVHSQWLKGLVEQSFLNKYPVHQIRSGVDLEVFKPCPDTEIKKKYNLNGTKIILGVASRWSPRKGLPDFIKLYKCLPEGFNLVLVGLTPKQIKSLPEGIIGITRTENVNELAVLYSAADAFVNPTWQDNFPTTNIEALACGTPVITYNTGGSPEAIDDITGIVVEKGDIQGLAAAVINIIGTGKDHFRPFCRKRAEDLYNKDDRYMDYLDIYQTMLKGEK